MLVAARRLDSEDSNARTILIRYRPLAFDGPSGQPPDGRPPDARATGLRDVEGDHLGQPLAGQVHPARVADVDLGAALPCPAEERHHPLGHLPVVADVTGED